MSRACYFDDENARAQVHAQEARTTVYKAHQLADFLHHKFGLVLTREQELMLEGELRRLFDANYR